MKKITILGAGAFGFAIAKIIGENQLEKEIFLFDVNKKFIQHIKDTKTHPIFHGNAKLPEHIIPTTNIKNALDSVDLIVLAIPSRYLREAVKQFKAHINKDVIFLNLAKGLEIDTNLRASEIVESELDNIKDKKFKYEMCTLSGGMIATEVTLQNPLCAEIACKNRKIAKKIAKMVWSDYLHIETTDDIIGVELAGAFKNVTAIGAGIFDGLNFGESSKSAFVSACALEMKQLALKLGAKKETFGPGGQAWFGDLMTTCFGKSRNREFGEIIGKGVNVDEAVKSMIKNNKSIEGYITTKVVHKLLTDHKINAPLIEGIYNILYRKSSPQDFISDFIKKW